MPLVSVIIPAYNAEVTIIETVESVLGQTFSDFELIVINDGSTDHTLEILDFVKDDRLKVFTFENRGLPAARNRGISHASGKFISFIDADDLWTPRKLDMQLDVLQRNPQAGVAYSWTVVIDEQGKFLFPQDRLYTEGNVYHHLLLDCFIASGSNILVHRHCIESVGLFDPGMKFFEDWEFYLRLASRWPFVVVPEYQILYRLSASSISAAVNKAEEDMSIFLHRVFDAAPKAFRPLKKECFANNYLHVAFLYLSRSSESDRLKRAGHQIKKSIRVNPTKLFRRKTQLIVWTWLLLHFFPADLTPRIVRFLLRIYGRLMVLVIPELRNSPVTGGVKSFL